MSSTSDSHSAEKVLVGPEWKPMVDYEKLAVGNDAAYADEILAIKSHPLERVDLEDGHRVCHEEHVGVWARVRLRIPPKVWRLGWHIFWGCFFTSWWLLIVIQDKHRHMWLIPTILWMMIMVRLITWHTRILYRILAVAKVVWDYTINIVHKVLPQHWMRLCAGAFITVAVILIGVFVTPETSYSKREDRAISFFGLCVAVFGLWATSRHRKLVQWHTVIGGILMQYIVALFVLRTKCGYDVFNFISFLARKLLGFSKDGVAFLTNAEVSQLGMFFFSVLPAVAFFVAFIHIWYYYGVIQWGIQKFAYFFFWTLKVSGAEAITASASPFVGIGESAILIKDLMPYVTKAELHQIMTSGFSTISGAVLVGYIGLGLSPQALVSLCVMSIPASLACSKLRYPETEESISKGKVEIPKNHKAEEKPQNVLQAFSEGATMGLTIALTMMIQCLAIIAMVSLVNTLLTWFGGFWNIKNLTLELMLSYLLYPVGFLLGTPRGEILKVTKLIATKFIQNEFVAYDLLLHDDEFKGLSARSLLLATFACCGFANFGSMGITLGVLNTISKGRGLDIASGIGSALITGGIATLMAAAVAGMVIHDLDGYVMTQG